MCWLDDGPTFASQLNNLVCYKHNQNFRISSSATLFDVRFKLNRYPLRCMHRALDIIYLGSWSKLLFPSPQDIGTSTLKAPFKISSFYNPLIRENEEQKTAVKSSFRNFSEKNLLLG